MLYLEKEPASKMTLHKPTTQITYSKQCVFCWVSIFQYYISEVQVNIYVCAAVLIWPCAVEAVYYLSIYRKKRRKTKIGATQLSSLCNIAGGICRKKGAKPKLGATQLSSLCYIAGGIYRKKGAKPKLVLHSYLLFVTLREESLDMYIHWKLSFLTAFHHIFNLVFYVT